ncbi:MAG: glycoside hydrolase family 15 protein [Acidobacteriota bacterium]
MRSRIVPYQPIENYGVIGDLYTVALVAMDGSIDFLCLPHFDSPTVFASLLDHEKGGRFQIAPVMGDARHKQLYLPDTAVLLTRFLADEGVAEISDFMPVEETTHGHAHNLVRRVKTIRGELTFRMICQPRFDYGRAEPSVERRDGEVRFISRGPSGAALRLRSDVPVEIRDGAAVAEFTLHSHQSAAFVLEWILPGQAAEIFHPDYVSQAFTETVNFWRRWVGRSTYSGRWREMVNRSAITLKLLTSRAFGALVAAPTFGLPETMGGHRNWDYRYTWIRDAAFTLYGLMRLGYTREAGDFMQWVEARCGELVDGRGLQVMYGIDGRHQLTEEILPHLEGYRGSSPVRIGNGAYSQLQLDIYGELMDAVYLYNKYGDPISHDLWTNLTRLIDWVGEHWNQPDEGIWEVRGGPQEFLYSRLMCWAALDRGIRLAQQRSFPAPLARWDASRTAIYRDIFTNFWDPARQSFVQRKGASALDASTLLMPLVKFISPTDPRWLFTLRAIEEELVDDSLVYRYRVDEALEGITGAEGTFSMCTFWYVECLARSGDVQKARFLFEKALGYANHLGLYAEELGPRGEHLGNFPQAFTHLALISAAFDLDRRLPGRS